MSVSIIVAVADNNAIGRNNQLLWHISEDLKFFKRTTSGFPVIMGSRTFSSIGRPLPKRRNIVISRTLKRDAVPGVEIFDNLKTAIESALGESDEVFIIGGGMIYEETIKFADKLYITEVHTVIEDADTIFPVIDKAVWKEVSRSEEMHDEESGYNFQFVQYERK